MTDTLPDGGLPSAAEGPLVKVKNMVVIGPSTSVDPETGASGPKEDSAPQPEQPLSRERFAKEQAFVNRFLNQIITRATPLEGATPQEQEQLTALQEKIDAGKVVSKDDLALLSKLNYGYPPREKAANPEEGKASQAAHNLVVKANLSTLLEAYNGESVIEADSGKPPSEVRLADRDNLRQAAAALGLLTTEASLGEDHWLVQTLSQAYRGLVTPAELVPFLQSLASPDALIITSNDLQLDENDLEKFTQQAVDEARQNDQAASLEERVGRGIKGLVRRVPVLRLLVENRYTSERAKLEGDLAYRRQSKQSLGDLEEQIRDLDTTFLGLNTPEKLGEQIEQVTNKLSSVYGDLPNQPEETQQLWFALENPEVRADPKALLMAITKLFGLDLQEEQLMQLLEHSGPELKAYAALKTTSIISLFALGIVVMQLYQGAKSTGAEGGGGGM
jgi:hypothetical protein